MARASVITLAAVSARAITGWITFPIAAIAAVACARAAVIKLPAFLGGLSSLATASAEVVQKFARSVTDTSAVFAAPRIVFHDDSYCLARASGSELTTGSWLAS